MFLRFRATELLDSDLTATMPAWGWVSSVASVQNDAARPILLGENCETGEAYVLASRDHRGNQLHFPLQESARQILWEQYQQSQSPSLAAHVRAALPIWFRRPATPRPATTNLQSSIVDWYRQLATWFGLQIESVPPWPLHYRAAFTITHNVVSESVLADKEWRDLICANEHESAARGIWFVPPTKCRSDESQQALQLLRDRGYELGCYGYNLDKKLPRQVGTPEFVRRWSSICRFADRWRIRGFRNDDRHSLPNDFVRKLGERFEFDASAWTGQMSERRADGCGTELPFNNRGIIELPASLPTDTDQKHSGQSFESFWRDQVRRAEQIAERGGLIVLTLHPHLCAHQQTWPVIAAAIEEITNLRGLWITRPSEIVDWWQRHSNLTRQPSL